MLAGVSTRKYAVVGEPVGEEVEQQASATGKSTIKDLFDAAGRSGRQQFDGSSGTATSPNLVIAIERHTQLAEAPPAEAPSQ
jgi:hypothetical protein